jgi:hypothetical protein
VTNIWLILGGLGLVAFLFRKATAGSGTLLSVKGGTVDIQNVEAVESRGVWQYSGIASRLWVQRGSRDNPNIDELPLVPGALYTERPLRPDPRNGQQTKAGNQRIYMDSRADGVEEGQWTLWWRPVVVTVQEQIARGVRTIPDTMRADDTEVP